MKELSNIVVGPDGILVDVTEGMEIICPTCKGKGKVLDKKHSAFSSGGVWFGPPPRIECRTCKGEGWVFQRLK